MNKNSRHGIFTKHTFLDASEARLVKSKLSLHRKRGIFGADDQLIGAPLDYADNQLPNYKEIIRDHNEFMKENFPDLLNQVKNFFGNFLGKSCFYSEQTSLPGFRIFTIPPLTKRTLWFHNDLVNGLIKETYPELGVTETSRLITFIVLLDDPSGLTSGLLYFPNVELGTKIMSYALNRHNEFEGFASREIYTPGVINVFEECVHSIYALNESSEIRERFTLQGHLIETPKGYLIFW